MKRNISKYLLTITFLRSIRIIKTMEIYVLRLTYEITYLYKRILSFYKQLRREIVRMYDILWNCSTT